MHLPTHALLGWLLAESVPSLERRDRALVCLAGVAPDLDALTALGGTEAYQTWHHVILHNVTAAVGYAILAGVLARRRALVGAMALVGFHLHLLCDYVGSAGPFGSKWSIPYFVPFDRTDYYCSFQWGLASWQNVSATILAMLVCFHLGARRHRTVLEVLSRRADAALVEVLVRRWPFAKPLAEVPESVSGPLEDVPEPPHPET